MEPTRAFSYKFKIFISYSINADWVPITTTHQETIYQEKSLQATRFNAAS